ncbi:MAG: Gfo/Idh/MocA family oxidoreductase [Ruminococcaceae bacterium]|nr:Gfo/Idh/MocA family oxidoreductase [Oscillospiraceae bacterium]
MNIGIIGFGAMGRTHAFAIDSLRYFYRDLPFTPTLGGIFTRTPETRENAAKEFGFAKVYESEDEMIADPAIDVIDITSPNIAHFETIKKAAAAGKHIYCEKPLCISEAEAMEAAELVKTAGVTAQIVFNTRFLSPIMRAKQLIDEGRLGRIITFRSAYLHASCTDMNKNAGWKQNRDICGGGVLFDLGSHAIDLVYHLCGEFEDITGRAQIAHPVRRGMNGEEWQTNADEAFYMIAHLKCGAVGTIEASKLATGTNDDFTLEIYGDKGALKFNLMDPNWLWFYDMTDKSGELGGESGFKRIECCGRYPAPSGIFPGVKAPIGWLRGHIGSMYAFLDAVHRGAPTNPSFDDGAYIQRIMEAAYRSDKSGKAEPCGK